MRARLPSLASDTLALVNVSERIVVRRPPSNSGKAAVEAWPSSGILRAELAGTPDPGTIRPARVRQDGSHTDTLQLLLMP